MKILRSAAICALLGSSVLTTAANAAATILSSTPSADPAGLDAGNLATAQAQCDAAATALDADGPSNDSDHYSATVVEGAVTLVSGPTEVGGEGARNIDQSTKVGAGTFTPAHREILGDPYRNGGSVNMFGIQQTVGGHYSNSAYDFTADFNTTYAHAYSCDASKETYHAAVYHPLVHHNQVGHWIVSPDAHGNEEANTNNCNAFNSALPNGPANGNATDQANCRFIVDEQAYDDPAYTDPAYWDDPVFVANVPGGSFNQTQTDQLSGHESMGAGFDTSETLILGQVVVCISPGPKGGSWKQQNGYTGSKCTTAWYNGGAKVGVPNLNDGSHNWVTIPVS
jgi:hypothetical protein